MTKINADSKHWTPVFGLILGVVQSLESDPNPPDNLSQLAALLAMCILHDQEEAIDSSALSERLDYARSTLGRMIGEFIESGMLEERIDPTDRRKRQLKETRAFIRHRGDIVLNSVAEHLIKGYGPDIVEVLEKRWQKYGSKELW